MKQAVAGCRPFLQPDTLVVSIAAGVRADTVAGWLGASEAPHTRLVRCMPNTPALIGEGASGLMALPGVSADDKVVAEQLLKAVGEVVRSEEHTSELQSLMRTSYAVFCLKIKINQHTSIP